MNGHRNHIVLAPGFAGFDMLGQLEYYAGVTPEFRKWQLKHPGPGTVLHYFDNFPAAAVVTRAARLRRYLAKRLLRGEFAPQDRVALVGHSTGGLDIRRLIWDLAEDADSASPTGFYFDGVQKRDLEITSRQILKMIRRVVFLSVPQWGTNIADWVKAHYVARKIVVDGLRTAVAGSQFPLLDSLEDCIATSVANHKHPDLFFAIRDVLSEAEPACGGKGERGAMAQEAASALSLWLGGVNK